MEKFDIVALGFCSNDYLALLPEIPIDNKVQILEHLVQGGGPAATAAVAAARLGKKLPLSVLSVMTIPDKRSSAIWKKKMFIPAA